MYGEPSKLEKFAEFTMNAAMIFLCALFWISGIAALVYGFYKLFTLL